MLKNLYQFFSLNLSYDEILKISSRGLRSGTGIASFKKGGFIVDACKSGDKIPKILMLTKGLSIYKNKYELLVDKLGRLLKDRGLKKIDISAVGGPCLATGLANRVHSSVVIANKDIKTAKKIANMLNTNYYHTSYSTDLNGVEVSAAIKIFFLWMKFGQN